MKKNLITTMLFIAAISASAQTRQLFDFGWQFTYNGTTQTVDLPHDWDIFEGPNSGKGATGITTTVCWVHGLSTMRKSARYAR